MLEIGLVLMAYTVFMLAGPTLHYFLELKGTENLAVGDLLMFILFTLFGFPFNGVYVFFSYAMLLMLLWDKIRPRFLDFRVFGGK